MKLIHFIVVVRKEDAAKYHLDDMVRLLIPDCEIVTAVGQPKVRRAAAYWQLIC